MENAERNNRLGRKAGWFLVLFLLLVGGKDKEGKLTTGGKAHCHGRSWAGQGEQTWQAAYRREGQGFFSSEARGRGKDKHENTLLELKHAYGKLEFASDALFLLSKSASKDICWMSWQLKVKIVKKYGAVSKQKVNLNDGGLEASQETDCFESDRRDSVKAGNLKCEGKQSAVIK